MVSSVSLTTPNFAPPGAPLAAIHQPPNDQLDLFVVGNDGAVYLLWEVNNGKWNKPFSLTPAGFATPGSRIAAAKQPPNDQVSVFTIGNDGAVHLFWEVDNGKWHGPIPITAQGIARAGSPIAAASQPPNDQLDVFYVGSDNRLYVAWEVNNGQWQGPAAISDPVVAPNAKLAAVSWVGNELRVLTRAGAQFVQASVIGAGKWAPAQPVI